MKVVIQHPSGAVYQGPNRYATEWWDRFSVTHPAVEPQASHEDEEPPKVVGTDGGWSGAQQRDMEYDSYYGSNMPVVNASAGDQQGSPAKALKFGFVRNEENE